MKKIEAYNVILRDIHEKDLEMLRNWRNNPQIRLNMINQDEISPEQQKKWFSGLEETSQEHYIVEYKEQAIGYANFKPDSYGMSGQTGLYIGEKKYRGTVLAFCLALALLDHVFLQLKFQDLKADVLLHNTAALRFNEQLGYIFQQKSNNMVKMKLTIDNYIKAKNELTKLIRV